MSGQPVAGLEKRFRPRPVELDLEAIGEVIAGVEDELRCAALEDRDRCCGYFPALAGITGFAPTCPPVAHSRTRCPRSRTPGCSTGSTFSDCPWFPSVPIRPSTWTRTPPPR